MRNLSDLRCGLTLALAAASAVPATARAVDFGYTGSIITYTVPRTGTYQLAAFGAAGGTSKNPSYVASQPGGLGTVASGNFSLVAGQKLSLLVGGAGANGTSGEPQGDNTGGGGGGGSFVVLALGSNSLSPLLVGGGGGGGGITYAGGNGGTGTPGGAASQVYSGRTFGHGGANGAGGYAGLSALPPTGGGPNPANPVTPPGGNGLRPGMVGSAVIASPATAYNFPVGGAGGGGYLGIGEYAQRISGGVITVLSTNANSFLLGGAGSIGSSGGGSGGFGGGGAAGAGGGGGGGYSGGGGGIATVNPYFDVVNESNLLYYGGGGGGGGSYNASTIANADFFTTSGVRSGNGLVQVNLLLGYLTASDLPGTSSFATGSRWSTAAAPTATLPYEVDGGLTLRTPAGGGNMSFNGQSLKIGSGLTTAGALVLDNASGSTVTITGLTLDKGIVINGSNNNSATTSLTVGGGITLAAGGGTLQSGAVGNTLAVSGAVGGSGAMAVDGGGTVVLSSASNTYTGATTVAAGTLKLEGTYATPGFAVASGATLELSRNSNIDYATVTFTGDGTLRKTGPGQASWGPASATFSMASGSLIDVQAGTFVGGSYANEVWTNNKSDLNIAAGAVFSGVEADVRVDALTGAGLLRTGYYAGNVYTTLTLGVDNGSGTFTGAIENTIAATPGKVTKEGTGTQTLTGSNTFTGGTVISNGTLVAGSTTALPTNGAVTIGASGKLRLAAPGTATITIVTLAIAAGGQVDLTDDQLLTATAAATVRSLIASNAIVSSTNASTTLGIGYKMAGTATLVRATLYGDADLDGGVSINDFNVLAGNFGQASGRVWEQGDFDYDGGVSINDFNLLAGNFGQSLPASSEMWAGLLAFAAAHNDLAAFEAVTGVPEPSELAVLAVCGMAVLQRRRR